MVSRPKYDDVQCERVPLGEGTPYAKEAEAISALPRVQAVFLLVVDAEGGHVICDVVPGLTSTVVAALRSASDCLAEDNRDKAMAHA